MPSQLFQELAVSQLELLASSMPGKVGDSKIRSMALYLPQENLRTGQLEFLPAILYPRPSSERVFIASDSDSGVAPTMPRTLTKLPGFAHATSLLPGYPMVSMSSSDEAGVGVVEEVLCDVKTGGTALSVPLFSGSQTVGVLLVSPTVSSKTNGNIWTKEDRQQVAMAAKSLSLALSMDSDRNALRTENEKVQTALSDSLHQLKNPLQALRTYGKLLQRRMADTDQESGRQMTPQLLELAAHLMVQSDRLVERLKPVDAIVDAMGGETRPLLNPVEAKALVPWKTPLLPWEDDAMEFARETQLENVLEEPSEIDAVQANERSGALRSNDAIESNLRPPPSQLLLGDMELEMSFVTDVLEPVFQAFRAIATELSISFRVEEVDDLPGVTIWPQALQESVINLLDNAFKYVALGRKENSSFEPQVRVRLLPNKKAAFHGPGVTILVEDSGPGIPVEQREQVFERGERGMEAQAIDGSGIGLDIARSLVEQMGGTLRIVENNQYPNSLNGAIFELVVYRKGPKAE